MSKILKQLCEVTEVNQKRGEDEADFKKRLIQAISELNDEDWNSLSAEAQDWFNDAVDAMNAKKDIPAFPDAEKEEPTSRRRSSKDPEPAAAEPKSSRRGAAKDKDSADVGVGDKVVITNKRGKTFEGEIVEMDDEIVVIKEADGEETEIARDRIESMVAAKKEEPKAGRRRAADDDKDPEPAIVEPKEGDEIEAVTARDKTVKGKVVEVADDLVVVDDGDGEIELTPSKLKSLKILGGKTKDEPKSGRRGAAKEEPADVKKPRTRSTNKEGVSATVRMRELIAEDFDRSRDDIDKLLKKEGLEFRPNTLDLVFADCHKFIKILDAAGKLK